MIIDSIETCKKITCLLPNHIRGIHQQHHQGICSTLSKKPIRQENCVLERSGTWTLQKLFDRDSAHTLNSTNNRHVRRHSCANRSVRMARTAGPVSLRLAAEYGRLLHTGHVRPVDRTAAAARESAHIQPERWLEWRNICVHCECPPECLSTLTT